MTEAVPKGAASVVRSAWLRAERWDSDSEQHFYRSTAQPLNSTTAKQQGAARASVMSGEKDFGQQQSVVAVAVTVKNGRLFLRQWSPHARSAVVVLFSGCAVLR